MMWARLPSLALALVELESFEARCPTSPHLTLPLYLSTDASTDASASGGVPGLTSPVVALASPRRAVAFAQIEADLQSYEAEARWQHANVIHGDPVRARSPSLDAARS